MSFGLADRDENRDRDADASNDSVWNDSVDCPRWIGATIGTNAVTKPDPALEYDIRQHRAAKT